MTLFSKTYNIYKWLLLFTFVFAISSCFSIKYSTTGASISPELKTFSVQYFTNRSAQAPPNVAQDFTEKLRDKCRSNTSLTMVLDGGDASFEGEIIAYDVTTQAMQSNDKASQNRFTITVHVRYTNAADSKLNFDSNFSRYQDFDASKDLSSVADELTKKIFEDLTEDIFNKAFVNW
jgi:predicted oxidoreductase